ncbi:unnamed protein product [Anisakis simplex]|uniref:Uncharacterized protein n=1 Tax=Anisakis simplex TaxID=6269 RepID=A0A3P6RPM8_ANISI|nr:unnamed protein product [Anisakis simplex]
MTEDVVEEQADEFVKHDNFYGGSTDDELPYLSRSINEDTSKRNYYPIASNMGVVPVRLEQYFVEHQKYPPYPSQNVNTFSGPFIRGCLDVFAFVVCIALVILQLGLIDFYYLTVLKDKIWYAWLGVDSLVIIILIWLLVLAVRNNQEKMEEASSADAKVKYAWVGWFAYSAVLVGKIAACFRLFHHQVIQKEAIILQLPPNPMDNNDKIFDDHLFRLNLALSALIFLFLLESHHYTPVFSSRQTYIVYLITVVCLDLIDTIYFLDLLWQSLKDNWQLPFWLDIVILSLSGVNFILPTFALMRLRFGRLPRIALVSDKIWALFYVLLVNAPYLGIRIYLFIILEIPQQGKHYDASIFVVKNVAMIYLAVKEVWTRLQYWRYKRNAMGSRGELTAHVMNTEDEA